MVNDGVYDALPIVDGVIFSDDKIQAGMFFGNGKIIDVNSDEENTKVKTSVSGKEIIIELYEDSISIISNDEFKIDFRYKENCEFISSISENSVSYKQMNGYDYSLKVKQGKISGKEIVFVENKIVLEI